MKIFDMLDMLYDWGGYNQSLFCYLNKLLNSNPFVPKALHFIAKQFNIEIFAGWYLVLLVAFGYKLATLSIESRWQYFDKYYDVLVHLGSCYAVGGVLFAALKFSINSPRPFCSLPLEQFTTIIDISKERCLSGFPSSHAGLVAIVILWARQFGTMPFIAAVIVGVSVVLARVALAMHYPADIFYGAMLGALLYYCVLAIYQFLFRHWSFIRAIKQYIKNCLISTKA